jgi:hypothetical protein
LCFGFDVLLAFCFCAIFASSVSSPSSFSDQVDNFQQPSLDKLFAAFQLAKKEYAKALKDKDGTEESRQYYRSMLDKAESQYVQMRGSTAPPAPSSSSPNG